jgi:NitT/TauT family transport system permease protein
MLVVILLYDQLFFRPLLSWSSKFKPESDGAADTVRPWFLTMLQKAGLARALRLAFAAFGQAWNRTVGVAAQRALAVLGIGRDGPMDRLSSIPRWVERVYDVLLVLIVGYVVYRMAAVVRTQIDLPEVGHVFLLGLATAIRVLVLIAIATAVWVPIGVWIGLRPGVTRTAQPIVQFMAAFPANLFFPVAVALILRFHANTEIWLSPLMILGTQWYILFNVIAGASSLPQDFKYVARNLGLKRLIWWRRLIIPAIFPAYITGALTAAGGSWNAAIVAEWVHSGSTTLTATGVGAYIAQASSDGDIPRIILGTAVLCVYVILFNRLFWRRLYDFAAERMRLDDV